MRGSCIRHPAKEPLIIVREWQIEACDGNRCAAILLSFFEYWHDIKLQMASKAARQNGIAIAHGDSPTQDETLLQFHNEQELEAGILGFYGTSSIRKAISLLKEKDFISVHANPNNRYKFDQTRYFLFHDEQINQWLEKRHSSDSSKVTDRGLKTTDGSFILANESVKATDGSFILRNDLYTETTPEITSEITEREEALPQEILPELEENSTQDPIADQSASLSKKQRDSADDGETSSETGYSAAQTFPPQKNNATANYEKRFTSPHKYPELIEAGYGEIMIGKGYLDFDPIVVEAAVRHLKKHELACEVGDGKRFISNRIKEADWAAIELLKEAAAALVCDRKKTEAAIAASTNSDEYYDTSRYYVPEPPQIDVEARQKAAERGIAKMKAALAEARKKRAS